MQEETSYSSNPLIQSVVYKSFSRAIEDIGLPEFTHQVFIREITPHLKTVGSRFPDDERSLSRMWKAIVRGEIIATEVWNDEILVFYVRGECMGYFVDIRLTCRSGEWHVQSVVAIYPRTLFRSVWFRRTAYAGGVLVAAVLGYAVHHPATQPVAPAPQQVTSIHSAQAAGNDDTTDGASLSSRVQQSEPRTITFTLSRGMALSELSKFLESQHLVSDATEFDMALKKSGVDRNIKPGVYTFHEGMSESQIIDVLKQGSSKS
ncbi:endolytic transglycosylase MltG [Alicyclobacillus macrosporangiidus]|uniref:endolytic transglycosylase MltG n=1 Tax=Alicyclobacillus macrosporangiidus TaxID=392015 RepID=UPI00049620C3|nr:endolytic transglycosylase MltG [Alicyclobacillus macrosporangiidus]MCL6598954.1 endolytic transglycosylase MltG [Alicyclobacillus macrosporangiidus]